MTKKIKNDLLNMNEEELRKELEEFKAEKEKIRQIIGQIGGVESIKKDKRVNILFIVLVCVLFTFDIFRQLFHFADFIPTVLSLELGLMLISIKLIWMIHKQIKVNHFQFHVLNSIEFRLNDISKQLRDLRKEQSEKTTT
ncbi:MAG: hypothetical protein PHS99_07710 [Candidatus Marinimicrobia bacterium]|nr:hypothetical protein [Candidatus Neomarinimicrobiota bacterium]